MPSKPIVRSTCEQIDQRKMVSERYLRDNRNCKQVNFSFSGKSWWMSKVFLITIENERVAQYRCWVFSIEAKQLVFTQVIIRQNAYCKNEHIETTNYTYTEQVCTENVCNEANLTASLHQLREWFFFYTQFSPVYPRGPKVIFVQNPSPAVMPQLEWEERQLYKRLDTRSIFLSFLLKQPCCSLICLPQIRPVRIRHRSHDIATQCSHFMDIELGGWLKWLPLNCGYNDVMHTAPILVERFLILIIER